MGTLSLSLGFLQENISIPGVRVLQIDDNNVIQCEYDPDEPPRCPIPGCQGYGIRGGMTHYDHIVYDMINEDPPQIVKLNIHHRRFRCSLCKQEIPLQSDYLAKGVKSSKRLAAWITDQCINNSPKKVSKMVDYVIRPSTISEIFERTADAKIEVYTNNLLSPSLLGVHYIPHKKKSLIFVTDVNRKYVIDVLWSQPDLTSLLKPMKSCNHCVTDIQTDCLVPVRGTIGAHKDSVVVASHASVYREITAAYIAFIKDYYTGQRPSIVRQFFSQPLYKQYVRDEIGNIESLFYSVTYTRASILNEVLDTFLAARRLLQNFNINDLNKWLSDIEKQHIFTELYERIVFAREELSRSYIRKHLQAPYDDITSRVLNIVDKCSKCSDINLRRRVLLAFPPKTKAVTKNGVTSTYYLGVDLADLEHLTTYNA